MCYIKRSIQFVIDNLAVRLETMNKETETDILISDNTAERLAEDTPLRAIGKVDVRGKEEKIAVYSVE